MSENHQNTASNNLITTENKIWLPPSYTNNKAPVAPTSKKRGIKWGFADRTVFDWTILVSQVLGAIAIPFVVTFLGLYATQQITQQQAQSNERQHQTDLQIANDQQQEATLQTYLDRMSELLLNRYLGKSKLGDEVRNVARIQTLTALHRLDPIRKGLVLQFLNEAGLISVGRSIVNLNNADLTTVILSYSHINPKFSQPNTRTPIDNSKDFSCSYTSIDWVCTTTVTLFAIPQSNLSGVDLSGANLENASLGGVDLSNTDLSGADLRNADLTDSKLSGADLSFANLKGVSFGKGINWEISNLTEAKSLKGATMPDGSKHP